MLANMVQSNFVENTEIQQAIDYYKKVIDFEQQNDIITSKTLVAMVRLGDIYFEKEEIQAITWYEKAAKMGSVYAKNRLGDVYYKGTLTKRDTQIAYSYYMEVVKSDINIQDGKVYAMESIADILLENEDAQAITWYEKAAFYDAYAQIKLGEIYFYGIFGKKDMKKAQYYFTQVVENTEALQENREYAQEMLDIIN